MSNYGVKDIKTLEGIEAIRLRPGMPKCLKCGTELKWIAGNPAETFFECHNCNTPFILDVFTEKLFIFYPDNCGYDSIALAAADNNCDTSAISKVCNGKRNKCGGFKWKYLTT